MLKILKKLDKILSAFEEHALSIGIIAMMVVLILNFLGRYIFGFSIAWTEEVGKLCMVVVTYLGLSYVTRLARHINMTVLTERLGPGKQKILQIFINLTSSVFFAYLCYSAVRYAMIVQETGRVTTTLRIPTHYFLFMVACGFLFTAIRFLQIGILNIIHKEDIYFSADHPGPVIETEVDIENMNKLDEEVEDK